MLARLELLEPELLLLAQEPGQAAVPMELGLEPAPHLSMAQATHELELLAITTHHKTQEEVSQDLRQVLELMQIQEVQALDLP